MHVKQCLFSWERINENIEETELNIKEIRVFFSFVNSTLEKESMKKKSQAGASKIGEETRIE